MRKAEDGTLGKIGSEALPANSRRGCAPQLTEGFFSRAVSACSFGYGELLCNQTRTRRNGSVCFVARDEP